MSKMELLSPAGSFECLLAAVSNGADAVYFGGGSFNARRYANNFVGEELVRAVDFCHEHGVHAYITLNTLLFDSEIAGALDFAAELYSIGVDAVLVQDLGLAKLIRRELPELTLHASTQMGVHDLGGLKYCESIGLTRAVLAREVSLKTMQYLSNNSKIELEAFAQGALCMSFSGSCLYSSMAGERSGNRGTCAQPCRKSAWVLRDNAMPAGDHCLSPTDICMLEYLGEMEKAGIACVKIEGRMKKPDYVSAVTRAYRMALDGASKQELRQMKGSLYSFFNRGEFNSSHLFGDSVRCDAVAGGRLQSVSDIPEGDLNRYGRNPIDMKLTLKVGERAELKASCLGKECTVFGDEVQSANNPQSREKYLAQLLKLGNTPFFEGNCSVSMDENCYLPVSGLNALRRDAADALCLALHVRNSIQEYRFSPVEPDGSSARSEAKQLTYVRVTSTDAAERAFENDADIVGVEPAVFDRDILIKLQKHRSDTKKLVLILPNAILGERKWSCVRSLLDSKLIDGVECNNVGQIGLAEKYELSIAGIGLNVLNRETLAELLGWGFDYVIPSVELTSRQFSELADGFEAKIIIYGHGRVPLMQLAHCPVREHFGCQRCKGTVGTVIDEAKRRFPLVNTVFDGECLVRLLNCATNDIIDLYAKLPETAGIALSFAGEAESTVTERLKALETVRCGNSIPPCANMTRGHYNRRLD